MLQDMKALKKQARAYAERHIPQKPLLSINEAAKAADRSPRWIQRQLEIGKLPFLEYGGRRMIHRVVLVAMLTDGLTK
jgi:hypothetical protein